LPFSCANFTKFPFIFCFSAATSNPKRPRQRVEEENIGDDATTKRDVSSVVADPLPCSTGAAPEQTPPTANLQVDAATFGAVLGQTWPSASRPVSLSTLSAVTAPKVLKAKIECKDVFTVSTHVLFQLQFVDS
jgi:hypothetical protein